MELIENSGVHIIEIMDRTACGKHGVPLGVPCWSLAKDTEGGFGRLSALCGSRIKKAGFNGKISPQSIRAKAPLKKDFDGGPHKTGHGSKLRKPNTRPASFNGQK